MSFLLSQSIPSYAQEQLSTQLASLSTLPITGSSSSSSSSLRQAGTASPYRDELDDTYVEALHKLSSSDVSKEDLIEVLKSLAEHAGTSGVSARRVSSADAAVQEEVMGRATTMAWKEVMEVLIQSALELEEERGWWEASVNSRRGVGIYLIQCKSCFFRLLDMSEEVSPAEA